MRLEVPNSILKERLLDRWLVHGMTREQAEKRAAENDLVNADLITRHSLTADVHVPVGA